MSLPLAGKIPLCRLSFAVNNTFIAKGLPVDRRTFIAYGTSGLIVSQLTNGTTNVSANESGGVPPGKDATLKVISEDPLVLETPDLLLAENSITPNSALFVRNHHGAKHLADMRPRPMDGQLKLSGLIDQPTRMPLSDLAQLPEIEVEMVLQCSGNFRSQFSKISPIKGTPWNRGGMGNVRFGGIRFSDAVQKAGITIDPQVRFVTAEGADQPEKEGQIDYEKSLPLDVLMARGLLATKLNGVPLPAVHGGPLRLVVPGYYGNVQVKWLNGLRFEKVESSNFFQIPDYRTPKQRIAPGTQVEYTFDNSDPNFDMKINSRIFAPTDNASIAAQQPIVIRGVAWNDGSAELVAVELSTDSGLSWTATKLGPMVGPYALRSWSAQRTFEPGTHSIWVRAVDAAGRTQPIDGGLFWNPGGYGWNGIEKIQIVASA
jgi:sulfite oxidase